MDKMKAPCVLSSFFTCWNVQARRERLLFRSGIRFLVPTIDSHSKKNSFLSLYNSSLIT